jgi:hypothetical protein
MQCNVGATVYFECDVKGNPRWNFATDCFGKPTSFYNFALILSWHYFNNVVPDKYDCEYVDTNGTKNNYSFLCSDVPDGKLLFTPWPNRFLASGLTTPAPGVSKTISVGPYIAPIKMSDVFAGDWNTKKQPVVKKESLCCCGCDKVYGKLNKLNSLWCNRFQK